MGRCGGGGYSHLVAFQNGQLPTPATFNEEEFSMASTAESIKEIFSQMPSQINPDAAKGMNSVIQFNLSGEGGGNYYVEIGRAHV